MNEELVQESTPADADDSIELDFNFDDDSSSTEDTVQPDDTEVNTPVETDKQEEVDFTPLLSELSKKVKYKDEEIKIDNLDDVITNYQKGKNYDTLQEKLNKLAESPQMKLINRLAEESGVTPEQYVELVTKQQEENEKLEEQREYEELIEKGVSEELAKKITENNRIAKEFQKEKIARQKEKEEAEKEAKKDSEYEEFLKAYPNIKADEIPKDVFIKAKESNLKNAYTEYLLAESQKEIETLKAKQKSPVKGVTEHGVVTTEKVDDFLKGFGIT